MPVSTLIPADAQIGMMNDIKNSPNQRRVITPLWIVASFVSLTETVLGIAVIQTTGGIQIALTAFVLCFPIIIAGFFFAILWFKSYVFYPPTEFGHKTTVAEYVEAMQRRPSVLKSEQLNVPPSDREKVAANEISDMFTERIPPLGFLILYAYNVSYVKKQTFDFKELTESVEEFDYQYAWGFIVAAKAVGLVSTTTKRDVVNVTYINEKLQQYLASPDQILERTKRALKLTDNNYAALKATMEKGILQIEQFFE